MIFIGLPWTTLHEIVTVLAADVIPCSVVVTQDVRPMAQKLGVDDEDAVILRFEWRFSPNIYLLAGEFEKLDLDFEKS